MHLDDRLRLVEEVLATNRDAFVGCDVDLHVSWTPRLGQDGILLSANLVRLLGELGAYIKMDTYTDD